MFSGAMVACVPRLAEVSGAVPVTGTTVPPPPTDAHPPLLPLESVVDQRPTTPATNTPRAIGDQHRRRRTREDRRRDRAQTSFVPTDRSTGIVARHHGCHGCLQGCPIALDT